MKTEHVPVRRLNRVSFFACEKMVFVSSVPKYLGFQTRSQNFKKPLLLLLLLLRVIKSRRMIWAGYVALMEEGRGVHKVLMAKPEGKRPLGRPRRRCEDNIKMDLQEVGIGWSWLRIGTGGGRL